MWTGENSWFDFFENQNSTGLKVIINNWFHFLEMNEQLINNTFPLCSKFFHDSSYINILLHIHQDVHATIASSIWLCKIREAYLFWNLTQGITTSPMLFTHIFMFQLRFIYFEHALLLLLVLTELSFLHTNIMIR